MRAAKPIGNRAKPRKHWLSVRHSILDAYGRFLFQHFCNRGIIFAKSNEVPFLRKATTTDCGRKALTHEEVKSESLAAELE